MAKLLLDWPGVDCNAGDQEGHTPLMEAVKRKCPEMVQLLRKTPAMDINMANIDDAKALDLALAMKQTKRVQEMIQILQTDQAEQRKGKQTSLQGAGTAPVMSKNEIDLLFPVHADKDDGFGSPNPLATPRSQNDNSGEDNRDTNNSNEADDSKEPVGQPEMTTTGSSSVQTYSLEELKQKQPPTGCDTTQLETYLSADEFQSVFGMDSEAFEKLPAWKQNDKKKSLGIF